MKVSEINEKNFKRIYRINWILCGPLLLIFSWPYLIIGEMAELPLLFLLTGSLFFAVPFTLTVLHGHISVALGTLQRGLYYEWQKKKVGFFKYPFHPVLFMTRMRIVMIGFSLIFFSIGYLIK